MKPLGGPVDPEAEEQVNYFLEMVKSPANFWGLMAALAAGSVAAVATGIAPALLIPIVAQAGLNGILGLFLPDSPFFREMIDRKKRAERREAARANLVEEVARRIPGEHPNWVTYHRLVDQLASLNKTAKNQATNLSLWDVERLDDSTLDYLQLWLARLILLERQQTSDVRPIQERLGSIERELEVEDLSHMDRRRMERARDDLVKVLARRRGYERQEHSMAASMIALADSFTELHARVTANPRGEDIGSHVERAVERMNVGEELDMLAELELDSALALSRGARRAAANSLEQPAKPPNARAAKAAAKGKR